MARRIVLCGLILLLASCFTARADWDNGEPHKWLQRPDITAMGIDVNASYDWILADDFQCKQTGHITAIHIWCSWFNDILPSGRPDSVWFALSIHADIPDSMSPTGYSMPGEVLWYAEFWPGRFVARIWDEGTPEGWMDPPENFIYPADSTCWQYNFFIPESMQFLQEGTPDRPVTYWLDVKATPFDGLCRLGWKTSPQHWNDDAVWGMGYEPYYGPWYELRYPPGHELQGSIDLAFVIVGEEQPQNLDWGDAPDSPGVAGYRTLAVNNGANHAIVPTGPWLGVATNNPDGEIDGQPHPNALGDDTNNADDEQGVSIPVLTPGVASTITFDVSGATGWVDAWFDWNGDGIWQHPGERVISGWFATGSYLWTVVPPLTASAGPTCARFRINSAGPLLPWGGVPDGEVEDYQIYIQPEDEHFKWVQEPDLNWTGVDVHDTDPYLLADDFLCTRPGRITVIDIWGSWLNDYLPFGFDPRAVMFDLSFHADIPAGPIPYSMPGNLLWLRTFHATEFRASIWQGGIYEGWMTPPDQYWFPADYTCWLYRFFVPVEEAFFQSGSEYEPIIYWLDVQAHSADPDAIFGWKTSLYHWNDDAVWGYGMEPYFGPWYELRYPPGHEMQGMSIDLAFRLKNEPSSGVPSEGRVTPGFGLYQNVPNPFSGLTTIQYSLPAEGMVRLEVFDVAGRLVSTLVDEVKPAGAHTATWSGTDASGRAVPAGVYFYRIVRGDQFLTQKMMLLK